MNTCVHAHGNNVEFFMEVSHKNKYPLIQIHCITKIMCQDLPLGFLDCLFGMCSAKTENLAVVQFTFFYWNIKSFSNFLHSLAIQIVYFVEFSELLEYQKYGGYSDCYRLFCFWQILFLMHSLLVLMKLSIFISGLSHEKVILQ